MSSAPATAPCRTEAFLWRQLPCGMQAPRVRSLASGSLADPATRVPRPTLRGAPREAGMQASAYTAGRRRHDVLFWFGLTEAVR